MKTLLPHQVADAAFLASKQFAGNFSGMGSGKTLTAIEAVRLVAASRTIVVCPPIAMRMWQSEFEAFNFNIPARVQHVLTGATKLHADASVFIVSYAIATKRRDELKALEADVLILDESHALKNISAKRTKAILGSHGLCESVSHTWCLSGTPMTRWNDDIFAFLVRAANGALRDKIGGITMQKFQLRYCVTQLKKFHPRQRFPTRVVVGNRNTTELNDLLFRGGLAVRRELKEVWAAMPPFTSNVLTVKLTKSDELREAMKAMEGMTQTQMDTAVRSNDESVSKARRLIGEAKVDAAVAEIVERIEAGITGILVGCWHRNVIDGLRDGLNAKGYSFHVMDGRSSPAAKARAQDAFNRGDTPGIIGQISAMGVAIDLQHGGSNILVVEEDWSPSVMDQFYARMLRMGQANHVHAEILTGDTKLEKAVSRIASTKAREANKLMEQG